jgi:hypothetical protein
MIMATRRELLIDAFNVMFAHPRLGPLLRRDLETARHEFLLLVNQLRPPDATRVYVVFDAHRDPGPPEPAGRSDHYSGSVHVVFARETADVWIQRRIHAHPEPRRLTVVTSDRAILDTVRSHGARHLRVSDFLRLQARRRQAPEAAAGDDKPVSSSRREIEDLERLFEERGEED